MENPTHPTLRISPGRLTVALLLLVASLVPFVVMQSMRLELHGGKPSGDDPWRNEPRRRQRAPTQDSGQRTIRPVACRDVLNDLTIYDPNRGLERESTKRYTNTDPPFWISLHSEHL